MNLLRHNGGGESVDRREQAVDLWKTSRNSARMTQVPHFEATPRPDVTAALTRGVLRHCAALGWAALTEAVLPDGRRADVMALDAKGAIAIIEVKSGLEDFAADTKWGAYEAYCDQFWFAVDDRFDRSVLPPSVGVWVADGFGAAAVRDAPHHPVAAARRKALTLRFARQAADRWMRLSAD